MLFIPTLCIVLFSNTYYIAARKTKAYMLSFQSFAYIHTYIIPEITSYVFK